MSNFLPVWIKKNSGMLQNRSTHKPVNAQLCHRRPVAGGQIRQTPSSSRMPVCGGGHYGSPHPSLHGSLVRNCVHMADNDYNELLGQNEFSNGGVYSNFDEYPPYQRAEAGVRELESAGRAQLLASSTNRADSPDRTFARGHLLDLMAPIFRTLKLFGFYGPSLGSKTTLITSPIHGNENLRLHSRKSKITIRCFLLATYTLLATLFNIGLFGFNIFGIENDRADHGLINVKTMTNIISGMKPLHNTLNLLLFFRGARYHALLWRQLAEIDDTFRRNLAVKLDVRKAKLVFLLATCVCFLVPFFLRASQYFLFETVGEMLLSDLSLLFVPLLSVWQIMPLYYYLIITSFIRWWCRKLRIRLQNDPDLVDRPLEFYYRLYLKLTKSVANLGSFFNPFAFFSLSTSLVVLCLTIYFLTNAKEILTDDSNLAISEQYESYFYVSWSCLHIFVAISYVLAMCVAGWRTNESARSIMAAVLSTRPTDEQSRFRVTCFLHRNQTQWHWGVTVWRAFPVERSFLFTLVSAISTYAVLLLKLQQKPCMCGYNPRSNNTFASE